MCKAIRDGGNRCPKHRHDSIALVQLASELSGMTRSQTEDMLVQLRREGRNPELVSQEEWAAALTKIDEAIEASDSPNKEALKNRMAKAREHGRLPSRATVYAMTHLIERSKVRGQNLENRLKEIAEGSGYTLLEVKEKYAAEYAAVDRSRGATPPPEYNQSSVRYAKLANLPQDRSTVTALAKVKESVARGPRRVTRGPLPFASSFIHEAGYDNGRLEVTFNNNPEQVFAYRDVPSSVWERMQAGSAGSIYAREIRGNSEYLYDTAEEAEEDGYSVRCSSCGQFAARSGHTCPARETREQIETETGLSTRSYDEVVETNPEVAPEADADAEDTPDPEVEAQAAELLATLTADTPAEEEAPYSDPEAVEDADGSDDEIATPVAAEKPVAEEEPAVEEEPEMLDDRGGLLTVTGPAKLFEPHVPTPTNQRHPERLTMPESGVIHRSVMMSSVSEISGGADDHYFTSHYYASSVLSEADKEKIKAADPNLRFVIGREMTDSPTASIIDIYDKNQYKCEVHTSARDDFDDNYNRRPRESQYSFTRTPIRPEVETFEREEAQEKRTEAINALNAMVESGDAVYAEAANTLTRKYKLDGNLSEAAQISFAKSAPFRAGIKAGKVVVTDVSFKLPYTYNSLDDQGYFAGTRGLTVSGKMAFKRNEDGVMEVVSTERSLRCGCRDYRLKYNCHHLNYIQRHAGNVAQQVLPAPRTHRLLTSTLSARADIRVVEPEGGTPFIRFDEAHIVRNRNSWYPSHHLSIPADMVPADEENATNAEIRRIQEFSSLSGNLNSVYAPASAAQIRAAIRRAPVELPVKAVFYDYRTRPRETEVTGHFRFQQNGDNIEATERSLKCTCADYQENYDCQHVRMLSNQDQMFLNINARNVDVDNTVNDFYASNRERWREVEQISERMRTYGETEEEAIEGVRIAEEERQRREREIQERRERENRLFYERMREREAERAAERERELAALAEAQAQLVGEFEEYRAERLKAWENVETPYTENPAAFKEAVDEALTRKKNGEEAVPFMTENVTDGICGDGPGTRAFGIELEFDIKRGVNKSAALRKIGQELHEAGLTPGPQQVGYHSAGRNGYRQWSFERDCTVDAELVSPIMKDTPEHWEQLRKVIEIVERNGGTASARAGSHVHVSSGSYQTKVAPHAELLRTFNKHEDVMYRLASDPKRGKHRGVRWCAPNTNDHETDISKDDARSINILGQHAHALGLNFESANNDNWKKANVEFRLWDSTLNAGVIQQQVAISVAMTDYAEREVEKNGAAKHSGEDRKRIGHGRSKEKTILDQNGVTKHTADTFKEANAEAATFFDKMFRTKKHRDAAASLFAVTNWQQSR